MAECSLSTLVSDACTNGFSCVPVGQAQIIELELIYLASLSDSTLEELVADATTNGFLTLPSGLAQLVEIQLLYLISGSTSTLAELQDEECTNQFGCLDAGSKLQSSIDLQLWYTASGSTDTLAELQDSACTGRFACLKPFSTLLTAVKLQLLYLMSASADTLDTLIADACTNVFLCIDSGSATADSLITQLLCDISVNGGGGGVDCTVTEITDGGGDTFDCYEDGDATTQTLDQGTGLGEWVQGSAELPVISGLKWWFDASDADTLFDAAVGGSPTGPDGNVLRWEDKSPNAVHAVGSGATNPIRRVAVRNGLDVVEFNSTTIRMDSPDSINGMDQITLFIVVQSDTMQNFRSVIRYQNLDGSWLIYPFFISPDLTFLTQVDEPFSQGTNTGFQVGWNYGTATRLRGAGGADPDGKKTRRNGVAIDDSVSQNTTLPNRTLALGRAAFNNSETFDGYMAELIAYDRVLSDTEIADVESYLETKWGF